MEEKIILLEKRLLNIENIAKEQSDMIELMTKSLGLLAKNYSNDRAEITIAIENLKELAATNINANQACANFIKDIFSHLEQLNKKVVSLENL